MTQDEKVEIFIKMIFEPVKDKPGYVWLNKRDCRIINIETLRKTLYSVEEYKQKMRDKKSILYFY